MASSARPLVALFLVGSLASAGQASAAFLDHGNFSTDTTTSLDWLDVTKTAGPSLSAIPLNEGWRLATGAEVRTLFQTYIGTPPDAYVYSDAEYAVSAAFIRQIGVSYSFNNNEGLTATFGPNYPNQISVDGIYDDGSTHAPTGIAEILARAPGVQDSVTPDSSIGARRWVAYDNFAGVDIINVGNTGHGYYVVRPTLDPVEVSEPACALLLIGGCVALRVGSRRRELRQRGSHA